jgi:hypothetical protein
MRTPTTRRGFLKGLAGVGAALVALTKGWPVLGRSTTPVARATVRWTVAAPLTGHVGSLSYHAPGNALDFFGASGAKVLLYIKSALGASGWGGITSINNSCSTAANPTHRCVNFNVATDAFVALSTSGTSCHTNPTVAVGNLVSGNGGQIGYIGGANAVANCYDPIHAHFGPGSMSDTGGPWPNQSVTGGTSIPWEEFV